LAFGLAVVRVAVMMVVMMVAMMVAETYLYYVSPYTQ
jgi:hypothetical protein